MQREMKLDCFREILKKLKKIMFFTKKTGANQGKPMYSWSMDDIATVTASQAQLKEALDIINVVPNPYYAFSEYERNRLETKVKITNLPEQCTVKIFTVNGKLVREFKKDSPITSLDWDLTNFKAIPVASGIYLIHVSPMLESVY